MNRTAWVAVVALLLPATATAQVVDCTEPVRVTAGPALVPCSGWIVSEPVHAFLERNASRFRDLSTDAVFSIGQQRAIARQVVDLAECQTQSAAWERLSRATTATTVPAWWQSPLLWAGVGFAAGVAGTVEIVRLVR